MKFQLHNFISIVKFSSAFGASVWIHLFFWNAILQQGDGIHNKYKNYYIHLEFLKMPVFLNDQYFRFQTLDSFSYIISTLIPFSFQNACHQHIWLNISRWYWVLKNNVPTPLIFTSLGLSDYTPTNHTNSRFRFLPNCSGIQFDVINIA